MCHQKQQVRRSWALEPRLQNCLEEDGDVNVSDSKCAELWGIPHTGP